MKTKQREVLPVFNRAVIFNTDADSFHGHPDPLMTPDGVLPSLDRALLLHRVEGDLQGSASSDTIYHARPGDERRGRQREARKLRLSTSICASGAAGAPALRLRRAARRSASEPAPSRDRLPSSQRLAALLAVPCCSTLRR
jgi:hypothetical protein